MLTCQPACTPLKNPESILAEPLRPCDDAPGLEVSLGKLLERGFIKLSICKKALKARVLQFKLLEAFGLCGLWAPPDCVYIPPYSCCQRW